MPDVERVAAIIDEIVHIEVLPRVARLSSDEILSKTTVDDTDDVVTVVDRRVESRLSSALRAIEPSAAVVGEEAAYERPELIDLIESDDPVWVIDPIDGTRNFAAGGDGFGIIVAWVAGGRARAAWLSLPARHEMFVAEIGGGAFLNGSRLEIAPLSPAAMPRGSVLSRHMPDGVARAAAAAADKYFQPVAPAGCSAVEYSDVVRGTRDFVVYYRLLPWDHAGPALILTEAGGCVVHDNGAPYTARSRNRVTIVARDGGLADRVREWLTPLP
jgi:fructose-1,6-bisphosphatase/inositol monophosphatase family enzyme